MCLMAMRAARPPEVSGADAAGVLDPSFGAGDLRASLSFAERVD